jgi:hypothetical protein
VLGDLFYSLGTLAGTSLGVVERRLGPSNSVESSGTSDTADPRGEPPEADIGGEGFLVDAVIGAAAAWVMKTALRPRSVSWPRVAVAGVGATVLADLAGQMLDPEAATGSRARDGDPDALLVRLASGVAMAAGYAAVLYPRLPGSPLAKGLTFGVMELAAAPHGGLARVATDTPGLKFPLMDLALPPDYDRRLLPPLAFGLALGLLYRPDLDDR